MAVRFFVAALCYARIEIMIYAIFLALFAYAGFTVARIRQVGKLSRRVVKTTKPFQRLTGSKHVLVLGDSTMFGAGIKDPANSIGGLLAERFPDATVETLAKIGNCVKDISGQMQSATFDHYDLIVIGVGGNDIVKLSRYSAVHASLQTTLAELSGRADKIVLCNCVNLANIGFFLFPLNRYFGHRSYRMSQLFAEVVCDFPNVRFADFYRPRKNDHYTKKTRAQFVAEDAFHPSDYANRFFFELIMREYDQF